MARWLSCKRRVSGILRSIRLRCCRIALFRPKYISACDVVDALLISSVIVVTDEGFDLCSGFTQQEVVSRQDAVDVVRGFWTGAKPYPT